MDTLTSSDFTLSVNGRSKHVVFVLSAAAETQARRQESLMGLLQAARSLSPTMEPSVFFLGNPTRYSIEEISIEGATLLDQNKTRASVLAPVMEAVKEQAPASQMVLVGIKRIFDLADHEFSTPPVTFMAPGQIDGCHPVTDPYALLDALHDPVEQVTIDTTNFAPSTWNNAAYQLALVEGQVQLMASKTHGLDVQVTGVTLDSTLPTACLLHASGRLSHEKLNRASTEERHPAEIELPKSEAQVFRSMLGGTYFDCPHCRDEHAAHTLRCPNDQSPRFRFQGRPIFPSLETAGQQGLLCCRDEPAGMLCRFVGQSFLHCEQERVYFALNRSQLYSVALDQGRIDWTTWQRLACNHDELQEHHHVVVYH